MHLRVLYVSDVTISYFPFRLTLAGQLGVSVMGPLCLCLCCFITFDVQPAVRVAFGSIVSLLFLRVSEKPRAV